MYNPLQQFFDYLRYREAVKKADKAHQETGERYYVMPSTNGRLIIMDRSNFRGLKRKHYIGLNAKVRDLVNECFYLTPYRNGDGYLDKEGRKLKLALYFSWCKSVRAMKGKKGGKNAGENKGHK